MKSSLSVRLLAAAAVVIAPLANAAYSDLFVFGDSLSDSGNNALSIGVDAGQVISGNGYIPTRPYRSGHYTNGAVWAQDLASSLGVTAAPSIVGGSDYAFGGAQTSFADPLTGGFPYSLQLQTAMFLSGTGVAPAGALYVIAGGGNNARATLDAIALGANPVSTIAAAAQSFASDIGGIVDRLQAAGAQSRNIIVWDTPNIGLAPAVRSVSPGVSALASSIALAMNNALQVRLSFEAGVRTFDVFGLLSSVSANPLGYGLTNASDACGAISNCDPSNYLFWDGLHPTSAGHQLIASSMLALALAVPEPSTHLLLLAGLLVVLGAAATRRLRDGGTIRRIPAVPPATSTNG